MKCKKCGVEKEAKDFNRRKNSKGGYNLRLDRCKACEKIRWQKRKDPYKRWVNDLKREYNITPDDYYRMLDEQGGVCKICKGHEKAANKRLAVDHCHATGKVRGLLCGCCNCLLGNARDKISTLAEAIKYLTVAESADAVGKERRDE